MIAGDALDPDYRHAVPAPVTSTSITNDGTRHRWSRSPHHDWTERRRT